MSAPANPSEGRSLHSGSLAALVALGLLLSALETLLVPRGFPFRLGLANLIAVLLLSTEGLRPALLYTLYRVLLAAFVFGHFLVPPTFYLALGGGLAATLAMGLARGLLGPWISVLGLSVVGGVVHLLAQVEILALFLGQGVLALLPALWVWGALAGLLVGALALLFEARLAPYRRALAVPA